MKGVYGCKPLLPSSFLLAFLLLVQWRMHPWKVVLVTAVSAFALR